MGSDEFDGYVQRSVKNGLYVLGALLVVLGIATFLFEAELFAIASAIFERVGVLGLAATVLITDAVVSPIPPDLVLVVVAKSNLGATGWLIAALLGAVSAVAGVLGSQLAERLRHTRAPDWLFGRTRARAERLFARHGRLAIALGALTPVPFSVTCWTAGMLGVPLRTLAPMALLRLPRFVVYYAAITQVDGLVRAFG